MRDKPKQAPVNKSAWIRSQPPEMPAAKVVEKAKAAGISLTAKFVYAVRSDLRSELKISKKKSAAPKTKAKTKTASKTAKKPGGTKTKAKANSNGSKTTATRKRHAQHTVNAHAAEDLLRRGRGGGRALARDSRAHARARARASYFGRLIPRLFLRLFVSARRFAHGAQLNVAAPPIGATLVSTSEISVCVSRS